MEAVSENVLSQAVVVWTGWDTATWPRRDEHRLVEEFGADAAATLLPLVRGLADDFYATDAHLTVAGLSEMGAVATARFTARHPEISDEAVKALEWCYTFDHK